MEGLKIKDKEVEKEIMVVEWKESMKRMKNGKMIDIDKKD